MPCVPDAVRRHCPACRVQHHGIFILRNDFTHDVNAFGFEPLQMSQGHEAILQRVLFIPTTYAAACAAVKPGANTATLLQTCKSN